MKLETIKQWESWEHLILEDLKRIERRIQQFYSTSSYWGDKKSDRERFVRERMRELILKSVEG